MKRVAITIFFLFFMCLVATVALAQNCPKDTELGRQNIATLLSKLEAEKFECSFQAMELSFWLGNEYARLATCTKEKRYQEYALQAYDHVEKCFRAGGGKGHSGVNNLARKTRKYRDRIARLNLLGDKPI